MPPDGMMGEGGAPQGAPPPAPPPGMGQGAPGMAQPQPTGPGNATASVANQGHEQMGRMKLALAVSVLRAISNAFPIGSDISHDILESVNKLAKHVAPGEVSRGAMMTEADRMKMEAKQGMPATIASLRGGGAQQAQPPGMMAA